jgi:two-component system, NarL family, response regulator DegU
LSTVELILADDHALFREGLAQILSSESDLAVIAQVSSGREVLNKLKSCLVDVVIMDVTMPDMDGIEATRIILEQYPTVKVLVLSAHEDRESLFAAIEAGAKGYLIKDTEPEELARAIRIVAKGGSVVSPAITAHLLEGVREMGYDPAEAEKKRLNLSDREVEVLRELATPKNPAQIGRELFISTKTVQNHISNIYRKLAVGNRTEAVMKALDLGLIVKG